MLPAGGSIFKHFCLEKKEPTQQQKQDMDYERRLLAPSKKSKEFKSSA